MTDRPLTRRPRAGSLARAALSSTVCLLAFPCLAQTSPTPPARHGRPARSPGGTTEITVQGAILSNTSRSAVEHYAGSRTVISSAQLHEGGARSLDDALQRVPGVRILDETGTGATPQIMDRGLYESRSGRAQILQDGIPLSLAPYGQTSVSLFPTTMDMVDRVDIVRGGAAVQYGPNNVGGVINLISRPIPRRWTTTIGDTMQIAKNGNALHNTELSTGGRATDRLAVALDANFQNGQDFRTSHNRDDVANIRLRGQYDFTDATRIRADVQYYQIDLQLAGALSPAQYHADPFQATRPHDRLTGDTTRGSVIVQHDLARGGGFDGGQITWTSYADTAERNFEVGMRSKSTETWRSDLPPQLLQSAPRNFQVWATQPQINLRAHTWGLSHDITAGARFTYETVGFFVGNTNLASGAQTVVRRWKFDDTAYALFFSDRIGLMHDRLQITPGLRFEHLDSSFFNEATGARTGNGIRNPLPGATVGYSLTPHIYLFADAQRSLRAPQVTQIIYGNNLDSELAWNYEAGARYFPNERTLLTATFYRIDFDNQIQLDNTSRNYVNLGATRSQGVELSGEYSPAFLPRLTLNAAWAYLDAQQRAGTYAGRQVPYAARQQVTAGLRYDWPRTRFSLDGYGYSRSFTDAANTAVENSTGSVGLMPGYVVFNTQLSHTLLQREHFRLRGTVAMQNMFDQRYFFRGVDTSPWGRQVAPGRTFLVGLKATL